MSHHEQSFEGKWYNYPNVKNALIAGALSVIAFALANIHLVDKNIESIIYIIAIILGGYHWTIEGISELIKEKKVSIEILMLAAAIGSSVIGMLDEAAFLVFLYGFAEGIEDYTYSRTKASIKKLLDLVPPKARIMGANNTEKEILAEELKIEDIFIVRPGEVIPTDGLIVNGKSSINEAVITGESIAVEKKEEDKVFAGTLNVDGLLKVKVTESFKNNTISKIINLVQEAQEHKSKSQLFIERFGDIYSPIILSVSLIIIVICLLSHNHDSFLGVKQAITFLVAASPCALIISMPIATAAGIGRAGRNGVLIKGGMHLENLGKVKAFAFDKTGTLTKGKPVVTDLIPLTNEKDILSIAYSIERFSQHPLAKAVVEKGLKENAKTFDIEDFTSIAGAGVKAKINNKNISIGKEKMFSEGMFTKDIASQVQTLKENGKSLMIIGDDEKLMGIIGFRDEIKESAKETIEKLKELGIEVVMLTGDNEVTAQTYANELGISKVMAGLNPEDKTRIISELENQYKKVAMVGDGINDAPALARATIGIAMGVAGTDAAIEAADVALMSDDLKKLVYAIELGKASNRISIQNIIFSILVLGVLIPSALLGLISVTISVVAHESSELLAVVNGLRVGKEKLVYESV